MVSSSTERDLSKSMTRNYFTGLLLAAAALTFSPNIFSQTAQHAGAAKTRSVSSQPDFSGVWFMPEYHRTLLPKEDPPFQPWAEALLKKRDTENNTADPDTGPDPIERCIPPGVPRIMLQPFPWEIVHAKDRVLMIRGTPNFYGWARTSKRSRADLHGALDWEIRRRHTRHRYDWFQRQNLA